MRRIGMAIALALAGTVAGAALPGMAAEQRRIAPVMSDDGLHTQPWFLNSFLALPDDLAETTAAGKRLAIIWEQRGCIYCTDTHEINFAIPEINEYVRKNFNVIQLNLWGDREVTDFDGQVLPEKQLARKWGIVYTPTIQFFPETAAEISKKSARDAEIVRMPGYFRPFHFSAMFHFVRGKHYKDTHFQKYLDIYAEERRRQGKSVDFRSGG